MLYWALGPGLLNSFVYKTATFPVEIIHKLDMCKLTAYRIIYGKIRKHLFDFRNDFETWMASLRLESLIAVDRIKSHFFSRFSLSHSMLNAIVSYGFVG